MTKIIITGAAGAVGRTLLDDLRHRQQAYVATDIVEAGQMPDWVNYEKLDIRGGGINALFARFRPEVVIHLASIVTPTDRGTAYAVDVVGSENILRACQKHNVRRLVVTSSGAAYGYHADNPVPLRETDVLRGNPEFAYADHKRIVEEMLAEARATAPALEQVILRVGTVLGPGLSNQITALFHKPRLLALSGSESPFVFIWVEDLARILVRAATDAPAGIYNVAGDGSLGIDELAGILAKPVLRLPPWLLKGALALANPLGLSRYGPQQVRFLQYRPVLSNGSLKRDFGYTPEFSSEDAFRKWAGSVQLI
jgi:UDP-glucose 4-epimerase